MLAVLHGELVEGQYFVGFAHEPQSCADHEVYAIEVAEVGRGEREVEPELLVEGGEVLQGGAGDDPAHGVPDEVEDDLALVFDETGQVVFYLVG